MDNSSLRVVTLILAVSSLISLALQRADAAIYALNIGGNNYTVEDALKSTDSSGFGNTDPAANISGDSAAVVTGAGGGLWATRSLSVFSFPTTALSLSSSHTTLEGNSGDPDLTTSVSGLPSNDYEVLLISLHRIDGGGTWFTEADLNAPPSTLWTDTTPGAIQLATGSTGQFGLFAHNLGTTGAGATSFSVGVGISASAGGNNRAELVAIAYRPTVVIPEPSTMAIGMMGLSGAGFLLWRRRKRHKL